MLIAAAILTGGGFVALIIGAIVHAPYVLGMVFAGLIIVGFGLFFAAMMRQRRQRRTQPGEDR